MAKTRNFHLAEIPGFLDYDSDTFSFNSKAISNVSTLTVSGDATFDTNTLFVDASANRVGIGTASPSSQLHIVGNGGGFTKYERTDTTINNNDDIGAIDFAHTDTDDAGVAATILCSGDGTGGQARLTFYTGTPTSRAERLRIDSSGNVGIGTTNPSDLLQVGGDSNGIIRITGAGTGVDFGLLPIAAI